MPTIYRSVSLAASGSTGANVPNTFSGDQFEFMRANGAFSCAVAAAATGTFTQLSAGSDLIAAEFPTPVIASPGLLLVPDHFYFDGVALTGDRLVCAARNTTTGAIVHTSIAKIAYQ